MNQLWIVVANHERAKVFERLNPSSEIRLIHELENSEGRLRSNELGSDQPGRNRGPGIRGVMGAGGGEGGRHSFTHRVSPQEHIELLFCKEIADFLRHQRALNKFSGLVLAATPHFIGDLLGFLDSETQRKLLGTVSKNLVHFSAHEVQARMSEDLSRFDIEAGFRKTG